MADLSFLSDSDDEETVESILSQAKELIVLEQVASINCSGFTDSVLPTHLDTRFQKLKSFHCSSSSNLPFVAKPPKNESTNSNSGPSESFKYERHSPTKKVPDGNTAGKSKPQPFEPTPESNPAFDSYTNSVEKIDPLQLKSSPTRKPPERKMRNSSKSLYGSSPPWDSSAESISPPQRRGCFWCSPKKASGKKSNKEINFLGVNFDWEKDDELLADLETYSSKGQKKLLKKAMKEEEKINREAEKIVKWAKQASARLDVSGLEGELSDNEHFQ